MRSVRSVSSQCHLGEVEGVRSRRSRRRAILGCDLGEVEGMRSWRSRRRAILASRFASEVEGCNLGAIRSRSRTAIWVRGVIWVWSLSLFALSLEMVWSENFHFKPFPPQKPYFTVKLKIFSVWPNFPDLPNMLFSGKGFLNSVWSQNKRSLNNIWKFYRSFCFFLYLWFLFL